jgi:hypothetical protein
MTGHSDWERRPARWVRALPALTLAAVLTITASTEYGLARTVLALPPAIAWALPVAIDSYVLAALRSGRDVPAALAVMAGALAAATGAHLFTVTLPAGQSLPPTVSGPVATAIMTVLVVVAWRVHVLIEPPAADPSQGEPAPVTSAPEVATPRAPVLDDPHRVHPDGSAVHRPSAPASSPADAARPPAPAPGAPVPVTVAAARQRPAQATTSTSVNDQDDEAILAAIEGQPPSIRALRRIHGLGQARAARIHAEATRRHNQTTSTNQNDHENSQNNHQNTENDDQRTEHNRTKESTMQINSETEQQQDHDHQNYESRIDAEKAHTCITDRVGQSRSTPDDPEADSRAALRIVGRS